MLTLRKILQTCNLSMFILYALYLVLGYESILHKYPALIF